MINLKKAPAIQSQIKQILSPSLQTVRPENIQYLIQSLANKIQEKTKSFHSGFALFDQDHDGKIYPQDFARAVKILGMTNNHQDIASLFLFLDSQRKGFLNYSDFSILLGEQVKTQVNTKNYLPSLFKGAAGKPSKPAENMAAILSSQYEGVQAIKKRRYKQTYPGILNAPLARRVKKIN